MVTMKQSCIGYVGHLTRHLATAVGSKGDEQQNTSVRRGVTLDGYVAGSNLEGGVAFAGLDARAGATVIIGLPPPRWKLPIIECIHSSKGRIGDTIDPVVIIQFVNASLHPDEGAIGGERDVGGQGITQ